MNHGLKFLGDRRLHRVRVQPHWQPRQEHWIVDYLWLRMNGVANAKVDLHGLTHVVEARLYTNASTNVLGRIANRLDRDRRRLEDHTIRGISECRALFDELNESRLIGNTTTQQIDIHRRPCARHAPYPKHQRTLE